MKKKMIIAGGIAAVLAAETAAAARAAFNLASGRKSRLFKMTGTTQADLTRPPEDMIQDAVSSEAELKNMPLETVTVQSHDGLTLVGHWYPAEEPKRTVIMFHGWRSAWYHDFGMSAGFMHDEGCNLLYIEQRAHGKSEGEYITYGQLERYDAQTWVDFAVSRNTDELPIYLCGISMGATTVLLASVLPLKHAVKGIIADCGFTSGEEILKDIIGKTSPLLPKNLTYEALNALCRRHTGIGYGDLSTVDAMRSCTVPVLFFHGEDDAFVPVEMTRENYDACASEKDILIVPGAVHGTSYCVDMEGYQEKVRRFFAGHDG